MNDNGCGCKNAMVIEGTFGEVGLGTFFRAGVYNEESSSNWGAGDRSPEDLTPKQIKSYTMINNNQMEVVVISWGATIVSLKCPDKYGHSVDVVLGFEDIQSYTNRELNSYIGCILGRCANRIKGGSFTLRGIDYQLTRNDLNKHHLHGGTNGFGRRIWESYIDDCSVVMSYLSEDNEEGYPGAVLSTVRFRLTPDNKLEICIRATTTKITIVNISHGTFFNLAGHDAGEDELRQHKMSLNCDRWTFADYTNPVTTGAIRGVGGTVMDLRIPKPLGERMDKVPPGEGFDHNFCVLRTSQYSNSFVARAFHPKSGRTLEVYSDQPGVQFYTGGRLATDAMSDDQMSYDDDTDQKSSRSEIEEREERMEDKESEKVTSTASKRTGFILGKGGARYRRFSAFSIQPQNYPNAINYDHFPSPILRPGQVYCHDLTYKFGVELSNYM